MNETIWALISKNYGTFFTLFLAAIYILNEIYGSNKKILVMLSRILDNIDNVSDKNKDIKITVDDIHEHVEVLGHMQNKFDMLEQAISQLNKISDAIITEIGSFTKDDMHIHSKLNTDIQDLKMILVEIKVILPNLQRDIDNIKYNISHDK